MNIVLYTDSVSDIPIHIRDEYNIKVLPLTVNFSDGSYRDGIEINSEELFNKMSSLSKPPTTSQITPGLFYDTFSVELNKGNKIIGIFLSSKLSGTYNASVSAMNMLNSNDIYVIDSEGVSFGYGLLVIEAAKMIRQGRTVMEVVERINYLKDKVEHRFIFDTLEYLKKGGRLSPSQAAFGSLLNIKPILTVKDGELKAAGKARGRKKAIRNVIEWIKENNFDLSNKTVGLYDANDKEYLDEFSKILSEEFQIGEILYSDVGCVVGTHSGPGCIAISFINE